MSLTESLRLQQVEVAAVASAIEVLHLSDDSMAAVVGEVEALFTDDDTVGQLAVEAFVTVPTLLVDDLRTADRLCLLVLEQVGQLRLPVLSLEDLGHQNALQLHRDCPSGIDSPLVDRLADATDEVCNLSFELGVASSDYW